LLIFHGHIHGALLDAEESLIEIARRQPEAMLGRA
jgi:hypothetical protein